MAATADILIKIKTSLDYIFFNFHRRIQINYYGAIWLKDGRDNFKVTKATVICEKHFSNDDIKKNMSRWTLKPGAKPSLNLYNSSKEPPSRKPPTPRNSAEKESSTKIKIIIMLITFYLLLKKQMLIYYRHLWQKLLKLKQIFLMFIPLFIFQMKLIFIWTMTILTQVLSKHQII